MRMLTVVNRTNRVLQGVWDGQHHEIPPGRSSWNEHQAQAFKRQNPVMGTQIDDYGLDCQYKIGIEEFLDDCSPLEVVNEGIERHGALHVQPTEVIEGKSGVGGRSSIGTPLPISTGPVASGFVDPSK